MTYEELKIQLDLNEPIDILKSIGKQIKDNEWFVICDDGDCHLFDNNGNDIDISKIKMLDESLISKNVEKVIVPDSIVKIKHKTFAYCPKLKSIFIPDSVKYIGEFAFEWCEKLTTINIPDSIEYIGCGIFYDCMNLTSINIPDSIKKIEKYTFVNCRKITSISIPKSVEYIEHHVFYLCENLKSLIFEGKTIDQVKSMECYPFGLEDESIIRCIN